MSTQKRRRTIEWDDPSLLAAKAASLSGLDYLRGMKEGTIASPPICLLIGFAVVEVEEGRVVFELDPGEHLYNPFNVLHGGVTSGLLDAATGSAVHSTLPAGVGFTSIEIKVNFIRPITKETGPVRCVGEIVHCGDKIAVSQAEVIDRDNKLYAHGLSTCMIFRSGWKGQRSLS
jgi:uncharacterized protein (TIGR00369 family)